MLPTPDQIAKEIVQQLVGEDELECSVDMCRKIETRLKNALVQYGQLVANKCSQQPSQFDSSEKTDSSEPL